MNISQIYKKITDCKNTLFKNYCLFKVDNAYYGVDGDKKTVFVLESDNDNLQPLIQTTKELRLLFNTRVVLKIEGEEQRKTVHILVCLSDDYSNIESFIRLTKAFIFESEKGEPVNICDFFKTLTKFFSPSNTDFNLIELQGLYTELYTIYYFHQHGIQLNKYWHSNGKMKFDFSLGDKKRIEIKSTMREERSHHFKHEQLISYLYDIFIVSYKLRHSDNGLSLGKLLEYIYDIIADDYKALALIGKYIHNVPRNELENICFDNTYTQENIRFIQAKDVPKINACQPNGVFNVEYDSDLSLVQGNSLTDFISWINSK